MRLLLGCIADDITGASDLALMLAAHGMPTTFCLGLPVSFPSVRTPAIVIALKIRTVPKRDAVRQAREAAAWLLDLGADKLFYKYCSTFDSTAEGNIGPVSDALLQLVDEPLTVLAPAFPGNGRTVRAGVLYVNGVRLSESSMRNHPLTPMTQSYLPDLMDRQTAPRSTGLVSNVEIMRGADAVTSALERLKQSGCRYAVVDTESEADLRVIAGATHALRLVTGAAGIASAIPGEYRKRGELPDIEIDNSLPRVGGHAAVLAGSCSAATRKQVESFRSHAESIVVDPQALFDGEVTEAELVERASSAAGRGDVLLHSESDPEKLRAAQERIGIDASAELVECTFGRIARRLAEDGVRKFIVAGGETSGAVAKALALSEFRIGPQIDPGVPWMYTADSPELCIAFKSGNFGAPDFFQKALEMLP